jgi:hypothetical protein
MVLISVHCTAKAAFLLIFVRADCIRGPWAACVRWVGSFVWGEAQPLAYKYVHLSFELIEQPF